MKIKNPVYLSLILLIALLVTVQPSRAQVPCGPSIIPKVTLFVNWPQFQYDAAHTGCNPYESILKPSTVGGITVKWSNAAGEASYTSAVVADGTVYVSLTQCCHFFGRWVYALNASTGARIWQYGDGDHDTPYSSPAVANGIVYFGSKEGILYALNAKTGALVWQYGPSALSFTPTVANGVVYAGSQDTNLYALNAATGALIWHYTTGAAVDTSPAVANGVVYVGSDHVYALKADTGAIIWVYPKAPRYSPSVAGGKVYTVSDQLYALNATSGALVWSYPATGTGSVAVGTGKVYLAASDENVYALNAATGALIWQHQPQFDFFPSSPVVANGVVYVGYMDYFYALDASTGAQLAKTSGSDQDWTSATVANGIVYVGLAGGIDNSGALYAFSPSGH